MTPLLFPAVARRAEPTLSLYLFERELPASERIIDLNTGEWTVVSDDMPIVPAWMAAKTEGA